MLDLREQLEEAGPKRLPPLDLDTLWRRSRRQVAMQRAATTLVAAGVLVGTGVAFVQFGRSDAPDLVDEVTTAAPSPVTTASGLDVVVPGWRDHVLVYQGPDDEIYRMRLDGSGRQAIPIAGSGGPTGSLMSPRVSPDLGAVTFAHETGTGDGVDIWVANIDGSGARMVVDAPPGTVANHPTFTPDGTEVLYTFSIGGQPPHEIRIVPAEGGEPRTIALGTNPAVSPDGTTVAYENGGSIWTIPLSGGEPTEVAAGARDPVWSPDGERVSFSTETESWVVASDGSDLRRVTAENEFPMRWGSGPYWSPDGRWVMALGGREVILIEVDGDGRVVLFEGIAPWGLHWAWPPG